MDMMFRLDTKGGRRLYVQIYEYIKSEIRGGRLLTGEKLPSTRILAENLQVSRSTVDLAYEQLVSEGYLEARPGSGYYVGQVEELYGFSTMLGDAVKPDKAGEQYRIDFSTGAIDMNVFPFGTWRKLNKAVLSEDNGSLFALGDPQGEWELRQTIARYLHASRGANISPEQLIIGAGNEYLFMLLEKLLGRHRKLALEKPTYSKAYRSFQSFAYEISRIPMDKYGMDVKELRKSGAELAYVMPSHQYPTGVVMPIGRRQELLKWAGEVEGHYIIEDDHDSEFRYKGKPIPCLQSIDRHDKVIYIGTFSKAIAPAIRISFMALPQPLLQIYKENYQFFSSTVSRIDQRILQQFMEEGHFERHLNRMRKTYRVKHDEMLQLLKPFYKKFIIQGENAGTYLTLKSKEGKTEAELIELARSVGVKVYGMSQYDGIEGEEYHTVLIGFGGLSLKEIQEGLELLAGVYL
ncbi:MAG: PLP-dependent aminotransferase family protein [Lachnospiraceae bacterium]|nr:PLP-dependent aminotransferase family protein [Lachnospiraceae bacterium]